MGGHVRFHGDGGVTTLPGYRASLSPRGVLLSVGKWYYEVVIISAGRGCVGCAPHFLAHALACQVLGAQHGGRYEISFPPPSLANALFMILMVLTVFAVLV